MELPGYTYDSKTKRYFKNPPAGSTSFLNVPVANESDLNRLEQFELEKKIDCVVHTISQLEMHDGLNRKPKSGSNLFSNYDSLIASRFTTDLFKFKRNVFLENLRGPRGNLLIEPYCGQLVACPEKGKYIL